MEVRTCAVNVRYRGFSVIPAFLLFFPGVERALLCRLLPPVLGVHLEGIAAAQGCSCTGLPAEKEGVTELSANRGFIVEPAMYPWQKWHTHFQVITWALKDCILLEKRTQSLSKVIWVLFLFKRPLKPSWIWIDLWSAGAQTWHIESKEVLWCLEALWAADRAWAGW